MGIIAPAMTSFYRSQTANIKAQSAALDAKIASNNARLAAIRGAIAANNAAYAATHSGSSSTSTSKSTSTGTTSSGSASTASTSGTANYTGGNQTVSNYAGGQIIFNAPYRGVTFSGSTYQFHSSSGTLTIPNVLNKVVDFRNSAGGVLAKAYAASNSGTIDGRSLPGYQFIVGSSTGSNNIYAGSSGSYLWGNVGNVTDALIGGAGADTFFVGKGEGNDSIRNASSADSVNLYNVRLSDIVGTSENNGTISLALNTGNTVSVQSTGNLSAKFNLTNGSYRFNHATKAWQNA